MALIRKHRLYQLATVVWGVVVFGLVILVVSGNARPYLAPEQLPIGGPLELFAAGVVVVLAGAFVVGQLAKRSWTAAGAEAGLSPRGRGGLFGQPELVGTVAGREVTARTVDRKTGGDAESGSNKTTFTVVETGLDAPTEHGLVIDPDGGSPGAGTDELPVDLSTEVIAVGDVGVLTESPDFARDALGSRAIDALQAPDTLETVKAGSAGDVFVNTVAGAGGLAGSMVGAVEGRLRERFPDGDAVHAERKGVVHDGAELDAWAQAVVAVADGIDDAAQDRQG